MNSTAFCSPRCNNCCVRLHATPRELPRNSGKLFFNGNRFQATFLSPEITRRFLNHFFVIIFPHRCLKIFHVMLASQKIHHQLKQNHNNYSNSLQHYEWPKSPCWHDTSISGDITKTQRRSASLKPASRGSPVRVQFPPRGATNRQLHPPTWPQEAGSKYWPWQPHKNPAIFSQLPKQSSDFGNPKKTSVEKTLSLSVVLKEA